MDDDLVDILDEVTYAIDSNAVQTNDAYHLTKAKEAARRALAVITDNYLIRRERLAGNIAAGELGLPAPRIQLVWERINWNSEYNFVCWHQIVYPVREHDERNSGDNTCKITLGGTMSNFDHPDIYPNNTPLRHNGQLDTPFRATAHVSWDMDSLGFPGYVIFEDTVIDLSTRKKNEKSSSNSN